MRAVLLIMLAITFTACSQRVPTVGSGKGENAKRVSIRRADHGKYLLNQSISATERHFFVQPGSKSCLNSSKAVEAYLKANLLDRNRERLIIILLDQDNDVIQMQEVPREGLTAPGRDSLLIIDLATSYQAESVILVQNHPKRSTVHNRADRELSMDLKATLETIDVELLDHIIISKKRCFSFADHRML